MILLLACVGLTFLVKSSALCEDALPVRPALRSLGAWGEKLQSCSFCVGFWCSAALMGACFGEVGEASILGAVLGVGIGATLRTVSLADALAWGAIGAIVAAALSAFFADARTTAVQAFAGAACAYAFDVGTLYLERRSV